MADRIYEKGCKCTESPCPYHPTPNRAINVADTRGIRELAEKYFESVINGKIVKFPDDVPKWLTAFAESIVEQCCKDVCELCVPNPNWSPAEYITNDGWRHHKGTAWIRCKASAIRSRWQEKK